MSTDKELREHWKKLADEDVKRRVTPAGKKPTQAFRIVGAPCEPGTFAVPSASLPGVLRDVTIKPHAVEPVIFDLDGEQYAVGLSEDGMMVAIENTVLGKTGFVWIDRRVWPRIVEAVATVQNRASVLAQAENAIERATGEEA